MKDSLSRTGRTGQSTSATPSAVRVAHGSPALSYPCSANQATIACRWESPSRSSAEKCTYTPPGRMSAWNCRPSRSYTDPP